MKISEETLKAMSYTQLLNSYDDIADSFTIKEHDFMWIENLKDKIIADAKYRMCVDFELEDEMENLWADIDFTDSNNAVIERINDSVLLYVETKSGIVNLPFVKDVDDKVLSFSDIEKLLEEENYKAVIEDCDRKAIRNFKGSYFLLTDEYFPETGYIKNEIFEEKEEIELELA